MPDNVVHITVDSWGKLSAVAGPPLLLPSCKKLEFKTISIDELVSGIDPR